MHYTLECATYATSKVLRHSILTSPRCLFVVGTLSFAMGKAIGDLLIVLGLDVSRSLRLARAHCNKQSWIHPSTSFEASCARITGALIGWFLMYDL